MTYQREPARTTCDEPALRIGVDIGPSQQGAAARRLLDSVEAVFPVRFEPLDAIPPGEMSGIVLGGGAELSGAGPSQDPSLDPRPRAPTLILAPRSSAPPRPERVALARSEELARPLRGRSIEERGAVARARPGPAGSPDPETVLATAGGEPVWWRTVGEHGSLHVSRYELAGIEEGEPLRDRLCAGSFMGLLPLIHFLEALLGERGWSNPPLRASFVVDDPNLHWPSYGFLKYGELVAHASAHGYHLGLATVPLDGWRADRRATALVAANPGQVSLLMHGNDHVARELGKLDGRSAAPAVAQALRRVAALERRTGVRVERVMAPPHGACSEEALSAMFRLGLEAACVSRPYPWLDGQPAPTALAGWAPAELVAGGLPVLPRHPLSAPRDDLPLRALLGQPLILYGHHGDFEQGLDVLARATSEIEALGDVHWGPLGSLARASYSTRALGDTLMVRMHARRLSVQIPAGISRVRVLVPEPVGGAAAHAIVHPGGAAALLYERGLGRSDPIELGGPGPIELSLVADQALSAERVPAPPVRVWPLLRRLAVEGRDRLRAVG